MKLALAAVAVAALPLAPTVPLVLRDAPGGLEAPRRCLAPRRGADRAARPPVPRPLPDRSAPLRPADRRLLRLRAHLPQSGGDPGLLGRLHRSPGRARLVRVQARRRVTAGSVGDAAPAVRLPAADVPRRDRVAAQRRARIANALEVDPATGRSRSCRLVPIQVTLCYLRSPALATHEPGPCNTVLLSPPRCWSAEAALSTARACPGPCGGQSSTRGCSGRRGAWRRDSAAGREAPS